MAGLPAVHGPWIYPSLQKKQRVRPAVFDVGYRRLPVIAEDPRSRMTERQCRRVGANTGNADVPRPSWHVFVRPVGSRWADQDTDPADYVDLAGDVSGPHHPVRFGFPRLGSVQQPG